MSWKYRRVYARIWDDERFRSLSERGRLVALNLLTGSQGNGLGFFRFSPGKAAEDLQWSLRTFMAAFREVLDVMQWRFDSLARVVLLQKWFKYNAPDNPNCLIAWMDALADLPASRSLFEEFATGEQYLSVKLQPVFQEAINAHRAQRFGNGSGTFGECSLAGGGDGGGNGIGNGGGNTNTNPNPKTNPNTTQICSKPKTPPAVCESFERDFWSRYPARNGKKIGKDLALKHWCRFTDDDRQQIAIAVKHYAASPDVQRGIGVKDPHRWLKNGNGDPPWKEWLTEEGGMNGTINGKDFHAGAF